MQFKFHFIVYFKQLLTYWYYRLILVLHLLWQQHTEASAFQSWGIFYPCMDAGMLFSVPAPINRVYTDAHWERQRTASTISCLFMLPDSNRDWDIAKFFFLGFFLCLMCLFLSLQLTASSKLTMSHIQGSSGIAFKSAPCLSVHAACMFLGEWTCVRGWTGNGRMKSWQRAVAPTPPACLCRSVCLSHQCVGEWLTLRSGSDTVVLSTLFQVRCVHWELSGHLLSWFDVAWETEAPLQRCCPSRWRFEEFACVWATEWQHLQCQIWRAILLTPSHMSRDTVYHTEFIPLFFSSL